MASHPQAPLSTPRARNGEPQPAPLTGTEPVPSKRDLASWWKQFKRGNAKKDEEKEPEQRGIFGVPLIVSIPYANVAISLYNEQGESYIYGYVPIVVAKCGVFLKEKATDIEGIFRLAGSEKRIKELRSAFDTPPRYGKGLDWTGYTVHDAANILRRYFNQLPEPIIPLKSYDSFRDPLRGHQAEAVGALEGQAPSIGGFDPDASVRTYQHLIKELPSLNRQLLLYILDLLAVFAAKSDVNKMTTSNLAAIFQPGILSHRQHDMAPHEYRLSQDVLIFLIDNQDHFLIGMEGTAVDANTVRHIESGPTTPHRPSNPSARSSGLGRSASAASSAGAESIRKFGGVRRNVSTSSRRSRHSGVVPSPVTPSFGTSTPPGSGIVVQRSNTVPSKKSPAIPGARFSRDKHSGPSTPGSEEAKPQAPIATSPALAPIDANAQPQEAAREVSQAHPTTSTNLAAPQPSQPTSPAVLSQPSSEDTTPRANAPVTNPLLPLPEASAQPNSRGSSPHREKSNLTEGPPAPNEPPTPATPGGDHAVARTFTQMLAKVSPSNDEKKDGRKPNKLQKKRVPSSNQPSAHSSTHSLTGQTGGFEGPRGPPSPLPPGLHPDAVSNSKAFDTLQAHSNESSTRQSASTLKPSMSPSASFRSHSTATEFSEAEPPEEPLPPPENTTKHKNHWHFHRREKSAVTPSTSEQTLGSIPGAEKSVSSISSGTWGRRSLQNDRGSDTSSLPFGTGDGKEEKKGGFSSWFRRQDRKEREAEKERARSPPPPAPAAGSLADLGTSPPRNVGVSPNQARPTEPMPLREKPADVRQGPPRQDSSDVTPTETTPRSPSQPAAAAAAPAQAPIQSQSQAPAQASASPLVQPSIEIPVRTSSQAPAQASAPAPVQSSIEIPVRTSSQAVMQKSDLTLRQQEQNPEAKPELEPEHDQSPQPLQKITSMLDV